MEQLTLALAKGRTAKDSLQILQQANIRFPDFHPDSRKLIFEDETKGIRMLYVKAVDVTTYVEKGAADLGIVGRDNILESGANIYEMLDLHIGTCALIVASTSPKPIDTYSSIKVASKYPNIASAYFHQLNIPVETITLNGSVELAPLIHMADVVVDIVETGTTIKENGLIILDKLYSISTRLIVNKASFATKTSRIQQFITAIDQTLSEEGT